jgi:hypothetical protein
LGWRRRGRIRYGTWGTGLFQSVYQRAPGRFDALPTTPEWYLLLAGLALLAANELLIGPLLGPPVPGMLFAACAAALVLQSWRVAAVSLTGVSGSRRERGCRQATVTFLTLLQPLARLAGRLRRGLTPWRSRVAGSLASPVPVTCTVWSEHRREPANVLSMLEQSLRARKLAVLRGGDFDRWDIHLRAGSLGGARLRLAIEDHGGGRQLLRFRVWPRWPRTGVVSAGLLATLFVLAAGRGQLFSTLLLTVLLGALLGRMLNEAAASVATASAAVRRDSEETLEAKRLPAVLEAQAADLTQPFGGLGDAA